MANSKFYLFGKYRTSLQDEYEREIAGKTPAEIKIIETKYEAKLEIIEQRILAESTQNYLQEMLFGSVSAIEKDALCSFLSNMREKSYGDRVKGDQVFKLSYFDDVKALIDKSLKRY